MSKQSPPALTAGPAPTASALRGDLTQGPIARTLLLFSIPTLLTNILQSLSGTINSIWVGRLIGEAALAATANANIVMFLVSSSLGRGSYFAQGRAKAALQQ